MPGKYPKKANIPMLIQLGIDIVAILFQPFQLDFSHSLHSSFHFPHTNITKQ
jgi:hypothetical protein